MKILLFVSILAFVYLEVTGNTNILSNELSSKPYICDSSYSCADFHTARICSMSDANGSFKFLGDIKCPPQRPHCDHISGTCVSQRRTDDRATIAKSRTNISNKCEKIFSCLDCNTAQICKPTADGLVFFKNMTCTDESPFCNPETGSCGTQQSLGCGKKDDFVCVHNGKFPDSDCYRFHICTNLTSKTINCVKPKEHYDPIVGECSDSVPCQSFSCINNTARKVPHPLDPRFFAFCGDEGPIVIDSCPNPYELNENTQVCEATCHYNGLIQDIDDCRLYYKCTEVILTESVRYFKKEKKQCPEGQAYDPAQYLCVSDISNIPGCKL